MKTISSALFTRVWDYRKIKNQFRHQWYPLWFLFCVNFVLDKYVHRKFVITSPKMILKQLKMGGQ